MTWWPSGARSSRLVGVALAGDRERGRRLLTGCWDDTTEQDAAQRCVLAHYLADLQDDLDQEAAWDSEALRAFAGVSETELAPIGIPSARGLEPSLRLNLGDAYRRQGRFVDAREQVEAAEAAADALPDDGYGAMIRGGLTRLRERVAAHDRTQG